MVVEATHVVTVMALTLVKMAFLTDPTLLLRTTDPVPHKDLAVLPGPTGTGTRSFPTFNVRRLSKLATLQSTVICLSPQSALRAT
jgi:hypothetical protein